MTHVLLAALIATMPVAGKDDRPIAAPLPNGAECTDFTLPPGVFLSIDGFVELDKEMRRLQTIEAVHQREQAEGPDLRPFIYVGVIGVGIGLVLGVLAASASGLGK